MSWIDVMAIHTRTHTKRHGLARARAHTHTTWFSFTMTLCSVGRTAQLRSRESKALQRNKFLFSIKQIPGKHGVSDHKSRRIIKLHGNTGASNDQAGQRGPLDARDLFLV
jgi:hypothetical protein